MFNFKGGNMTFCQCGQSAIGCYGKVTCDCSDPRGARCISGESIKDVEKILNIRSEKKNKKRNNRKNLKNNNNYVLKKNNKNNNDIKINDVYFKLIKNGKKKIIVRPNNSTIKKLKPNNTIILVNSKNEKLKVKLIDKTVHDSLLGALKVATLKRTLPGVNRFKKAINIYNKINTFNTKSKEFVNLYIKK